MPKKKSQISIELLFVIGIILILFLGMLIIVYDRKFEVRYYDKVIDKRNQCLSISDAISSVYTTGPGAEAKIKTNYLVKIWNSSLITLEEIENITYVENKIAVLASEAGETTQVFYDTLTVEINPDWYKVCFSDIDGAGCRSSGDDVDYSLIPLNLHDLIENIDNYQTIYLEDPTIQYDAEHGGKTYFEIIGDWVAQGNVLILAEHVVCRESSYGSYPPTSYRCNPPGYGGDVWEIFGKTLHQKGDCGWCDVTVVSVPDINIFPDLYVGQVFNFEENSYADEEPSIEIVARYNSNKPAIFYWDYGAGRIFYFGDFQVLSGQQAEYSEIISDLIELAYSSTIPIPETDVTCTFNAKIPYYESLTGELYIKNIDNVVIIENETSI